ncbi:unnamed protein product [Nezara viridula]|uniref:Atg6 BARA domain-containing protein n=1 Tax=Nezara viridula TaxID=85310 RepID=A0A9P0H2T5_NEZVI|nr:unnamed protein product [Nezara viridula]
MFQLEDVTRDTLEDFILLEALPEAPSEINRFMNISTHFSNLLSSNVAEEPHACEECINKLKIFMNNSFKGAEEEYRDYKHFLNQLKMESFKQNIKDLKKQLKDLLFEEETLKLELNMLKEKEEEINSKVEEQIKINEEFTKIKLKYSKKSSKYINYSHTLEEEIIGLKNQISYNRDRKNQIDKRNIFEATFRIWHDHDYGTINGFRLGYIPSSPVEWTEVNTAWGQISLLLFSIANKLDFQFKNLRLVPNGNNSYIEMEGAKKEILPLFGSGNFRYRWDSQFDKGMVAFLDCLGQLKKSKKGEYLAPFPYTVYEGRLREDSSGISHSIKIQFNSAEHWTKSLKFLLTNLKWALVSLSYLNRKPEKCFE